MPPSFPAPAPHRRLPMRPGRRVFSADLAFATAGLYRPGRAGVPAGTAVERPQRPGHGAVPAVQLQLAQRADARHARAVARRTASFRALVAADLAETLRKRLSMYVLRAKVVGDRPLAVPRAVRCRWRRCAATPFARLRATCRSRGARPVSANRRRWSACPTAASSSSRPASAAVGARANSRRRRQGSAPDVWRWLGIRAGVPVIARCDPGSVRAADGQLGSAGRRQFPEGLLSGPGDRRAHAVPRAAQGAHAPVPRRRTATAAGTASLAPCSATRRAAPSSTPRPPPAAAATSLPSCK